MKHQQDSGRQSIGKCRVFHPDKLTNHLRMSKVYQILSICFFLVIHSTVTFSQTSVAKAEAVFIYNFTRLIEWPSDFKKGDFVIGIYGTTDVLQEISHYMTGKTVGSQSVKVVKYNTVESIGRCHILFVAFGKSNEISLVQERIGNNKTLIVGEKNGLLKNGAAINFVVIDNNLKFELNSTNASKYGLKILSALEKLSINK